MLLRRVAYVSEVVALPLWQLKLCTTSQLFVRPLDVLKSGEAITAVGSAQAGSQTSSSPDLCNHNHSGLESVLMHLVHNGLSPCGMQHGNRGRGNTWRIPGPGPRDYEDGLFGNRWSVPIVQPATCLLACTNPCCPPRHKCIVVCTGLSGRERTYHIVARSNAVVEV